MQKIERLNGKTESLMAALIGVLNEGRFSDVPASEIVGVLEIMKFSVIENLPVEEI